MFDVKGSIIMKREVEILRQLFIELKNNGVEEYDIYELIKKVYGYIINKNEYGKYPLSLNINNSKLLIKYFIENKELLYDGNSKIFILNPMETSNNLSNKEIELIKELADYLTVVKVLEDAHNVRIYKSNLIKTYSTINAAGRYLNLGELLVTDARIVKENIVPIEQTKLYECPIDNILCSFMEGYQSNIDIESNPSYVSKLSISEMLIKKYKNITIYTNYDNIVPLMKIVGINKEIMEEFNNEASFKLPMEKPKTMIKKIK